MALTVKQQAVVRDAPKADRKRIKDEFEKQNATNRRARKPESAAARKPKPVGIVREKGNEMTVLSTDVPRPVPSITHEGRAYPLSAMTKYAFTTDAVNRTLIFAFCPGDRNVQVLRYVFNTGASVVSPDKDSAPLLAHAMDAGGPLTGRPMKFGVELTNFSKRIDQGGAVYVLPMENRLEVPVDPLTMTETQWQEEYNKLVSHPRVQTYNGMHFAKGHRWHGHVVDDVAYHQYLKWSATPDFNGAKLVPFAWLGADLAPKAFSMFAFMFPPAGAANENSYALTIKTAHYFRYALDTVPGSSMREVPTAPPAVVNHHHALAERHGSVPNHVSHVFSELGKMALPHAKNLAEGLLVRGVEQALMA